MAIVLTSIDPDSAEPGEAVEATIVGTGFPAEVSAELHGADGRILGGRTTRVSSTELTLEVDVPERWDPQTYSLVVQGKNPAEGKALDDAFEVAAPEAAAASVPPVIDAGSQVVGTKVGAVAGEPVLDGDVFGIALTAADEDDQVLLCTTGTWLLPRAAADTFVRNARVMWDDAEGEATTEVGSPAFPVIGTALEDRAPGAGNIFVRLFGVVL